VDALEATGHEGGLDQVFATSSIVTTAAMLVGTISGGVLGSIDLAVPFLVRSVLLVVVFVVAFFTMHDLGFTPKTMELAAMPSEMKRIARASVTYGWENRSVRLLIIAGFFQASFMAWGFHAWQPYFLELLGQNLTWVAGLIAALVSLAMIAGNSVVEWFTRYCGKRTTLLLWALGIQVIATIGVGLVDSFWLAVPLYLISMAALGVWSPVRQAYIHQIIPSEQRATVISFDSLVTSSGSAVAQFSLGRLAQTRSIAVGYVIGGITMAIALPFVYRLRKRGDEADIIVGTAGKQGACPVQGIPQVSAVDSNAGLADT
jgi:hypothetical protein